MGRRLDTAKNARILALHEAGKNLSEIAAELGVSVTAVRERLTRCGARNVKKHETPWLHKQIANGCGYSVVCPGCGTRGPAYHLEVPETAREQGTLFDTGETRQLTGENDMEAAECGAMQAAEAAGWSDALGVMWCPVCRPYAVELQRLNEAERKE